MLSNNGLNYDDPISYLRLSKKTSDYLNKKKKYYTMGDLLSKTERVLSIELPSNIFEEVKLVVENLGLSFALSIDEEKDNLQNEIDKINYSLVEKERLYNKLVDIFNDSEGCKELVNLISERKRLMDLNIEMDKKIEDITLKIVNIDSPQKKI